MSDAALQIARQQWLSIRQSEAGALLAKTEILLPPQEVVCTFAEKPVNDVMHFAFVGRDFYRKGGLEVLRAFSRLYARGRRDWQLTLVANLESYGDYASQTCKADKDLACDLISQMGKHIRVHRSLPNADVLALLRTADYLLFPSLADTFGYSVLEGQACGAVVITTNIRALPEVNDSTTGFVIALDLDERREIHSRTDFRQQKERLIDSLEEIVQAAISLSRRDRQSLAEAATTQLKDRHCPFKHAARAAKLYLDAIGTG